MVVRDGDLVLLLKAAGCRSWCLSFDHVQHLEAVADVLLVEYDEPRWHLGARHQLIFRIGEWILVPHGLLVHLLGHLLLERNILVLRSRRLCTSAVAEVPQRDEGLGLVPDHSRCPSDPP